MTHQDRTMAAALFLLGQAVVVGYTDNQVYRVSSEAGLWQFHALRSVLAWAILLAAAAVWGMRLRPQNPRAVAARSAIHGAALMIYFGALGFLPVAQVAAGLFSAPIFVLLINRYAFGLRITPVQAMAVAVGFCGVVLVLGPAAMEGASLAALLPVVAGALYALGNVATRSWCAGESAATLLGGFFLALGVLGVIGMTALSLFPQPVPAGGDGWLLRGPVWPTAQVWFWTFVQAAGSLLGVGLMIRGYQLAEAAKVSVFEYVILPASALWAWVLKGEVLGLSAIAGMVLIAMAGVLIALGPQPKASPLSAGAS